MRPINPLPRPGECSEPILLQTAATIELAKHELRIGAIYPGNLNFKCFHGTFHSVSPSAIKCEFFYSENGVPSFNYLCRTVFVTAQKSGLQWYELDPRSVAPSMPSSFAPRPMTDEERKKLEGSLAESFRKAGMGTILVSPIPMMEWSTMAVPANGDMLGVSHGSPVTVEPELEFARTLYSRTTLRSLFKWSMIGAVAGTVWAMWHAGVIHL